MFVSNVYNLIKGLLNNTRRKSNWKKVQRKRSRKFKCRLKLIKHKKSQI